MNNETYHLLSIQVPLFIGIPLVAGLCLASINGKLPFLAGIYTAIAYWITTPVITGISSRGIQLNWILVPLIAFSSIIFTKKSKNVSVGIDKVFVGWILGWIVWIGSLVVFNQLQWDLTRLLLIEVFFGVVMVLFPIFLFSSGAQHLRSFAYAFLITFIIEAIFAYTILAKANIVQFILLEQTASFAASYAINYHAFARVASLSLILGLSLFFDTSTRRLVHRIFLVFVIAFSGFFIVWSGTRQFIFAASLGTLLFLFWAIKKKSKWRWLVFGIMVLICGILISLVTKYSNELRLTPMMLESHALIRINIWENMWSWFLKSPIFGNGPFYGGTASISHNLFLDALSAQGIVGFVYLIGFLGFIFYFSNGTLKGVSQNDYNVWRMGALIIFIMGLIQAQFSANVLSAWVVYLGAFMVWRLNPSRQHYFNKNSLIK